MVSARHLSRAPVIEALIDLRVHIADGMTAIQLEQAIRDVSNFGYHKKGPVLRAHVGFTVNAENSPIAQSSSEASVIGLRLHSADDKYVAQLTIEGFTLSRLEPYESWESLVEEAKRIWTIYRTCAKPTRIHRTAARYINNLRLPIHPGDRFEKYLNGLPSMPPDYPQDVLSFLQRFVVQDASSQATAILTQALDQVIPTGNLPVILDIDVFRDTSFPADSPDVWSYLADLRALKNRFFFGALTEAAMELYS